MLAVASLNVRAADKRPMTFDDLMAVRRVGEPVPSPDGRWVVYDAVDVNLEANTKRSHLWIVPAEGGKPEPITQPDSQEGRATQPRFSPKGGHLAFLRLKRFDNGAQREKPVKSP